MCRVQLMLTPTAQSLWLMKTARQVHIQNKVSPLLVMGGMGASCTSPVPHCRHVSGGWPLCLAVR